MVVPALVLLPSLTLPLSGSDAVPGRLACRLGARIGFEIVCAEDLGRGGYVFSIGLIGDCGKLRELCDLGDKTPAGPAFRARVAFEFAVTIVLVLFFGLGISCPDSHPGSRPVSPGMFSLSSPIAISSLEAVSVAL